MERESTRLQRLKPKGRYYINGKRCKLVPECANCHCINEDPKTNDGWEYLEINPFGVWGWICPKCQSL